MAEASAKSLFDFIPTALKGMTVDILLALTEGLRNARRCYGEDVRDHGTVTNWRSGFVVAGKTFVYGMADGISDIVLKPYQGAKEEGTLGAVKGFGKGMANMGPKIVAAMFGVMVYPGAGIAKSLRSSIHPKRRKQIIRARHKGKWLIEIGRVGTADFNAVITAFKAL